MSEKKKIIDAEPAAYPKTNTPEYNSVVTLIHILNKSRIKFDLNILDKFPNTDGIFEVVSENQTPIGKIDIQIKVLGAKNIKKPKYQCDKPFLAYCQESILPVLLVVVDTDSEKAYWIHMSREFIKKLANEISGASINVDIPLTNIISKTEKDYITNWTDILNTYVTRLINFQTIEAELLDIKKRHSELQKITNPALGIEKNHFKEIHLFLDYYNDLLNKDFSIIKNIFYRDYWKFGIAYSNYSDNSLQYSLYSISYESNDIQIKEIDHNKALTQNDFLNYVRHYRDNPIKNKPLEYAYKYIIEDLKKVVDNRTLLHIDKYIAIEYITAFIDKNVDLLGLSKNSSSYDLDEIETSISDFLPVFCEVFYKLDNGTPLKDKTPGVDIDYFHWHVMPEDITKNNELTKIKISNGYKAINKYSFLSKDFNLEYLKKLILHLRQIGLTKIDRLYPIKNSPKKNSYFKWEVYKNIEVKESLSLIFENLPRIYDSFVGEYFPNILNEIKYFSHFNRLIINIRINEYTGSYQDSPSIESIHLKNLTNPNENRVDVYLIGEDESPITWSNISSYWKKNINLDGNEYKLADSSSSILDNIYEKAPMQEYLYDTLRKRLEEHLKPYHDGINIFRFTRY